MTILKEIQAERERQDKKWGEQNHPFVFLTEDFGVNEYSAGADIARLVCDEQFLKKEGTWEDILNEEVWEALEQAAKGNTKEFREELIQVAAVVVAMIECLDRNGNK